MKFNSNINNLKCIEWQLNLAQAFLLDVLISAQKWANKFTIDTDDYRWVSRGKIVEEIPHIFKTTDNVYRNLKKLAQKGIIKYIKQGKRDLIRITEKGLEWLNTDTKNTEKGVDKSVDNPVDNCDEENQNSEINPKNTPQNSDLVPTDNNTSSDNNTKEKKGNDFFNFEFTEKQKQLASELNVSLENQLAECEAYNTSKGNYFGNASKAFTGWLLNRKKKFASLGNYKNLKHEMVFNDFDTSENSEFNYADYGEQEILHPSHIVFESDNNPKPVNTFDNLDISIQQAFEKLRKELRS
ncbi:MAG: hypothetical protein KGV51_06915 [Moraxellaceae bacterium]|nr:hypothetical protein [Moraxellaceae bacterium]